MEEAEENKLILQDYLIQPIQRISKYHLLLLDLKRDAPGHIKVIDGAYKVIVELTNYVNDKMEEEQNKTANK